MKHFDGEFVLEPFQCEKLFYSLSPIVLKSVDCLLVYNEQQSKYIVPIWLFHRIWKTYFCPMHSPKYPLSKFEFEKFKANQIKIKLTKLPKICTKNCEQERTIHGNSPGSSNSIFGLDRNSFGIWVYTWHAGVGK